MADTAKRLAGPAQLTNAAATKYTTPAATTTIIRSIHVYNAGTVNRTFSFSIGTDAAGTRVWDAFTIAPKQSLDWSGFMVLAATEIVQAFASANTDLTFTMSGIEVT